MKRKFAEHKELNLSQINKQVLQEWMDKGVFGQSLQMKEGCPKFVFFEGPPSANGHPGIHHVLARTIKDTVCRYKSMRGFSVPRKAGWDTHGLPVELSVEKELGITKADIGTKITVEEYNHHCKQDVMKYTSEWRQLSEQMGYWVDLDHPYITYDNKYIESLWWLLKQLFKTDLLYKGYTIQPYSPAAGTGLSSHELNQPGCYRDVKDMTVTAQFKIVNPKKEMVEWGVPYFLAWTTTPWTLPSNTSLCVGPKIEYVAVQTYNPYSDEKVTLILAKERLNAYLKPEGAQMDMGDYKHGDKVIPYRVVGNYLGSELVGMQYEQLMPWVKPCVKLDRNAPEYAKAYAENHPEKVFTGENGKDRYVEMAEKAFRVIPGDYVTTEDGAGIVHIANTFGADDARVANAAQVPPIYLINKKGETRPMVDLEGKYYNIDELDKNFVDLCVNSEEYSRHAGDYVKNAYDPRFNEGGQWDQQASEKAEDLNMILCLEMKQEGIAYKMEKHVHNYPHCWRTDKPIVYYPLDSWFIRSTACRERMIELNKTITWKPESTGSGRFGKWLENLNDWNLSRSRYWGTPLPIWSNDEGEYKCIGSVEELYNEIERSVEAGVMQSNPLKEKGFVPGDFSQENYDRIDLHRPYVDEIVLVSESGRIMHRESDLIDVWFDSGSMPYAQLHYPFENKDLIDEKKFYPADFIAEGVDQTRGWFFTLHAIACMVFDSVAFKSVISNGLVLDKNGNKMSKRLGNAVNPFEAIEKYGSDPLRWYMVTNSSPWDNLKFDENGVQEVSRTFFGKLHQTYSFLAMYANVDQFDGGQKQVELAKRPEIDRWILSQLHTLIHDVTEYMEDLDLTKAGRIIESFVIDDLSNWYVRLNRKRFWAGGMTEDKLSAYQTLYTCLDTITRLMAPLAPFYADALYRDLQNATQEVPLLSVHVADFPVYDEAYVDKELEERMKLAQKITSMVLSLRKKQQVIVRQPLQRIMIPVNAKEKERIELMAELIKSEVNVKEIQYVTSIKLEKTVKCNFRVMGKKFGKLMGSVAKAVGSLSQESITELEQKGVLSIPVEGQQVEILSDEVEIFSQDIPGWSVVNEGSLTVALDLEITEELKREGMAREIVKRVQTYRKDNDFQITDHIQITMQPVADVKNAVESFKEYICSQVLCDRWEWGTGGTSQLNFDDFELSVTIEKI
ncbi:MAG: isoleucine--tRNA ligase [Bacteroidaceae bacterium]|nr:isoleucine--tRNA ligase [Bacteroidaceae bacterium]